MVLVSHLATDLIPSDHSMTLENLLIAVYSQLTSQSSFAVKFFKNVAQPYTSRIKPTIDSLNKHVARIEARVAVHNTHGIAPFSMKISSYRMA